MDNLIIHPTGGNLHNATGSGSCSPAPLFTINLVRELRGSPITILVAFLMLEKTGQIPITAQLLRDVTGYGEHTITDSLRVLESPTRQIIRRVLNGWRLSVGFQLPLEIQTQNRENRGFIPSSCSSLIEATTIYSGEEQEENRESRGIRENRGFSENYSAAMKAGIRDPKASKLAELPHVTPDLIRGHVALAKRQGHTIGTAISRIEHNWPIEDEYAGKQAAADHAAKLTGHKPGCNCIDCQFVRAGGRLCPVCRHYQCECEDPTSPT
jgi:hypothetical protein